MNVDKVLQLIKLPQSLFALPWVLSGAFAPFLIGKAQFSLFKLLWVIVAFMAARTAGMAANRLIDARLDALNPRTASRLIPSGRAKKSEVMVVALLSSLAFVFSAAMINTLCLIISPLPLALIWLYSWTKRFTSLCHFILGIIEFLAPVCAWVAMTGEIGWAPFFLGSAFMCLISGADIIYALQDFDFDLQNGVHSIPVYLGKKKAIILARILHLSTLLFLILFALSMGLTVLYSIGCMGIALILFFFHQKIQVNGIKAIPNEFFFCLSYVSMVQFTTLIGEVVLWRIM